MDTFYEQLVKIKMNAVRIVPVVLTYIFAAVASVVLFVIGLGLGFAPISFLVSCALFYVAWYSTSQFFVEFEYIFTNGDLDVDRIVNQRKRKRVISFKCSEVEKLKKYSAEEKVPENCKVRIFACTPDENSYSLLVRTSADGLVCLVFSPDDRMIQGMKKYLPRTVSLEVFGN